MKWIKPNGTEIETNDDEETVKYCQQLGWEKKKRKYTKKENATKAQVIGVTDTTDVVESGTPHDLTQEASA